jgi:hypothetical protein
LRKKQKNQKYSKTRALPTLGAKNPKMEIFEGNLKNLFLGGLGAKKTQKNQKYTKNRVLPTF